MKKIALVLCMLLLLLVSMFQFCSQATANPYIDEYVFNDILPPEGTQPPKVAIHSPQNNSLHQKNVMLNFDVSIPNLGDEKSIAYIEKVYYKASWQPNETAVTEDSFANKTSFSIDLNNMPEGNLSIMIYAVGLGGYKTKVSYSGYIATVYMDRFRMTGFSTVSFVKDSMSPVISIDSPQNTTYTTSDVRLDFVVSESVSKLLYCLDGKENQTLTGNLTFTNLTQGMHNVTLYATDLAGNSMASETLFFSVYLYESLILPAAVLITATTIVSVGLFIYLKKRSHARINKHSEIEQSST
jgi:hypothetical protein